MKEANLKIEKKAKLIDDVDKWFKYGEPKGGATQWKVGRSAYEFARYMTSYGGVVPSAILQYLHSIGIRADDFECEPERVTSFSKTELKKLCTRWDLGKGGGRHHDGLMWSNDKNCVIGIEAKVSESFDRSIKDKIKSASKNHVQKENTKKRILESIRIIKGAKEKNEDWLKKDIMYQLLSATIGTVIEAKKLHATRAVFLVIEFTGNVYKEKQYETNVGKNRDAYINYMKFLGFEDSKDKDRYIEIDGIKIWFKKLSINIGNADYS